MRHLVAAFIMITLVLVAVPLAAQTDIDNDLFAGRITQPTPPPPAAAQKDVMTAMIMDKKPAAAAAPAARFQIFVNPLYANSPSSSTGALTTGLIVPASRFRASVSYNYIDPSSGAHLDSYGGSFRWKPWASEKAGLSIVGSDSDTQHVSRKAQAGLVGEFLVGRALTVSADLRWVRKSSSTSRTDDLVPLLSAGWKFTNVILGGGYTLKNDVDRQDNFEGQAQFIFKAGVLAANVGKHGTWKLGFTRTFDFN
jgi:hypothetical protein